MSSKFSRLFQSFSTKTHGKKKEDVQKVNGDLPSVDPLPPSQNLEPSLEEYQKPKSISRARRRLTVDGDEAHLDGIEDISMDIDVPSLDQPEEDVFVGVFAGKSQKGYIPYNPRKVNQDWMLIKEDSTTGTLVLGTFDGHGEHGHCISEFICTNFYNNLVSHEKFSIDVKTAAVEALAQAEAECNSNRFIKTEFSGTTAVICIIRGSSLTVLNVGDSRAILASEVGEECVVTELTRDHKPNLPDERSRIEKAGGRVFSMEYDDGYDGPMRVWLKDQDIPGLAMSRSICDTVAHSVGVISEPEVYERILTDDDRVLVMGSDGLWEFIPSQEVIHLIEDCEQPDEAVERLCTISWKRWFDEEKVVDDTTIIVVFLGRVDEA